MSAFNSDKNSLQEILDEIKEGVVQLPVFQRGWIWPDDHIQKIIASVSQSFPIGAVLMLTNGGEIRFATRPIEGIKIDVNPDKLILDGQQRLTALFQSLVSKEIIRTSDTRENNMACRYYLDMKECAKNGTDREESVIPVPKNGIVRKFRGERTLDLSAPQREYAQDMFPVNRVFDANQWKRDYLKHWNNRDDKWNLYDDFDNKVIKIFETYQVPVITLDRKTSKEEVCLIFERVNSQGVELTVFELLTASFAADEFDLRKDWEIRNRRMKEEFTVLNRLDKVNFLQALALISVGSCKRRDILNLTTTKYQELACQVEKGFKKAAYFLDKQNILTARYLPYPPQLVPLAAILAKLGDAGETEEAHQKITHWYWCGIFGELYGSATETRFANDLSEVITWVKNENSNEPRTIRDANFHANRILDLRTGNSAAYKGVYALLMRGFDFYTGNTIRRHTHFNDKIEVHHVFPKAWCKDQGISPSLFNSIINKTPLLARTNRMIGGAAPSKYLNKMEGWGVQLGLFQESDQAATPEDKLNSHLIPIDTFQTDDFNGFFEARKEALLEAIEEAMGKPVNREDED